MIFGGCFRFWSCWFSFLSAFLMARNALAPGGRVTPRAEASLLSSLFISSFLMIGMFLMMSSVDGSCMSCCCVGRS